MKRLLFVGLIFGSLAAGWLWRTQPTTLSIKVLPDSSPAAVHSRAVAEPNRAPPAQAASSGPSNLWAAIDSPDLSQLITHLRQVECPEQTIRDIVTFRVCRRYYDCLLESERQAQRLWDYTQNRSAAASNLQEEQRADLRNAMDLELERALGLSADRLKYSILVGNVTAAGRYEYLPLAKQGQIRKMEEHYRRLIREAQQGLPLWASNPAVQPRLNELNQQKQADLAALLTPQELRTFQLHDSPAARYVLSHLPEAQSEAEYALMVQAVEDVGMEQPRSSFNRRYGLPPALLGPDTAAEDRRAAENEAGIRTRLKELLGEPRLEELERAEQDRLARLQPPQ